MARGHCCLQLIATVIDNLIVILLQVLLLFLGLGSGRLDTPLSLKYEVRSYRSKFIYLFIYL
jgi:type IV secretory pathway TrbL component